MSVPSSPTRDVNGPHAEPEHVPAGSADPRAGRWNRPSLEWVLAIAATLAAAILPAVAWPDQISWAIDEPQLIARAYHANAAGTLVDRGLVGNFGFSYGPTATQIYQLLLGVTHDPLMLARLRAGLCAGVTGLGLLWLARSLRLNPWFAVAVVLAPFLWVFQRILWDASFAIPIGTLAVAGYAAFLRGGGRVALVLALLCTLTMPFIHPQDLPLAAPILLHMIWRQRRALFRNAGAVLLVAATVLLLNLNYFLRLFSEVSYFMAVGLPTRYPGGHSRLVTYLGPVGLDGLAESAAHALGTLDRPPTWPGRHLLAGHGYMGPGDGGLGPLVELGKYGLYVFYPLLWVGIAVAAWRLVRNSHRGVEDGARPLSPTPGAVASRSAESSAVARVRATVGGIALAGVLLQMLMAGATRVPAEPQYFFGTFALHALLAWLGVDALARMRLGYVAIIGYGLSAAAVTLGTMRQYFDPMANPPAVMDAARDHPTLGDSVAVAEALRSYPADVPAVTDINFYQRFPQTLRTLRLLAPPADDDDGAVVTGAGPLLIRFRPDWTGSGAKVEVVETASAADIAPQAQPVNVAPLPAGWRAGME